MARIKIVEKLYKEISKKFKGEGHKIFQMMESLEKHPRKGKTLTHVGNIVIKELKYKSFRFYFITNGNTFKFLTEEELVHELITFVRMSDKDTQQQTISEIKEILVKIGPKGF